MEYAVRKAVRRQLRKSAKLSAMEQIGPSQVFRGLVQVNLLPRAK